MGKYHRISKNGQILLKLWTNTHFNMSVSHGYLTDTSSTLMEGLTCMG